jgi:NAD(P)-dependent dehydrogenase (short-subunit alcohol dehydrogenase family)
MRFVQLGLRVCIADIGEDRLSSAAAKLSNAAPDGAAGIMTIAADVSRLDEVQQLEAAVRERFGGTDVLMNNAGIQPGSGIF